MADSLTDTLVAFFHAIKDDPSGSDASRAAAHTAVDALTSPPPDASSDGGDQPAAGDAAAQTEG